MNARHMQEYECLRTLGQALSLHEGVTSDLRDNVLYVARTSGGRVEQVTCALRTTDANRLWLWDSRRAPIAPAGHPDAPALTVARLR